MNVLVLNGSPKGNNSVTLYTALFLEKKFPQDRFVYYHVGQQIKKFEKDILPIINEIEKADLLLFAYPVYTFMAPYQLHRFIELLKEHIIENKMDYRSKYAVQITTSMHFYDITAHSYLEENCHDMGFKVLHGLSADMNDLLAEKGQEEAISFWRYIKFQMAHNLYEPVPNGCGIIKSKNFSWEKIPVALFPNDEIITKNTAKDVVILTNANTQDEHLVDMIARFRHLFPYQIRIINIAEFPFTGGCVGCYRCVTTGKCIHPDGFDLFLRQQIERADAIVYAFTIKDHSMGASFKIYDDRQFCNGHRIVNRGMPMGYLISGAYSVEPNLQMIIQARNEVGCTFLAGVATDEMDDGSGAQMMESMHNLSLKLTYALQNPIKKPQNFYGIGGLKIFRDLIFLMQGFMKEDYRFYKKHHFFDFPQKRKKDILKIKLLGFFMFSPKFQKKITPKINTYMIMPYKKLIK
ncbi:MAG: NAD(P)H-dependent oxidoreductase [Bacteroidales bacterium]